MRFRYAELRRGGAHLASLALIAVGSITAACSEQIFPGAPADELTLDGTIDGLSPSQVAVHTRGDLEFGRRFTANEGLGPLFVAASCESCHAGEGKGHPLFDITRFGRPGRDGFDPMADEGGPQLQHRAIQGYLEERMPLGAIAVARFTAPAVTGLGLLEAVDDATILALADPTDVNGDGISGRVSLVDSSDFIADLISVSGVAAGAPSTRHMSRDGKYIGRFGKKARTINLLHQTVFAYSEDMGVTTDLVPRDLYNRQLGVQGNDGVNDPEIGSGVVDAIVFYLRTLRAPRRRNGDAPAVREGERIFADIGCSGCHVAVLRTGVSDIRQLNRVTFAPFTDLLLHDMGSELDDGYTEGDAAPAEWRTAPLWGVGLAERAQGGSAHLLHDGRAKSLREAIRFHGGEGARSRASFDRLAPAPQGLLLLYLRSL